MEPEAYTELAELEATHWWYEGMRSITEVLLRAHLPQQNNLRILDAGCGTGGNLKALAPYGTVYGFDYSTLALNFASRDHAGQLARASVDALPYPSEHFDLVTSFDVLVCAEVPDDVASMREFARVTRPGGHVLVRLAAMKSMRGPHDTFVHGVRRYSSDELAEKLRSVGLEPLKITYANSLLLPLIYPTRKWQNWQVAQGREPESDVSETAAPINAALRGVLGLEAAFIKMGGRFPLGVSVMALAVKAP